jgi:uncharacterized membrane protein YpjA
VDTRATDRRPGLGKMVGFGFLSWLIVFAAAMAMYPWRVHNRPLFESAIAVVLAATTVTLAGIFFRRATDVRGWHGFVVGFVWATINMGVDLAVFSVGPMRMALPDYLADIGVTYLMIPVLTTALALQRHAGATAAVRGPAAAKRG